MYHPAELYSGRNTWDSYPAGGPNRGSWAPVNNRPWSHTQRSAVLSHAPGSGSAAVHVILKAVGTASGCTASPVYFPHTAAVIKQDLYLRTTTKISNKASSNHYCSQGRAVKIVYFNRRYWRLELSQRRSFQQVGPKPLLSPVWTDWR